MRYEIDDVRGRRTRVGATSHRQDVSPRGPTSASPSQPDSATDGLRLANGAQQLQPPHRPAGAVEARPSVDPRRVDLIRNAIRNGSYTIDAASIADKLLGIDKSSIDRSRSSRRLSAPSEQETPFARIRLIAYERQGTALAGRNSPYPTEPGNPKQILPERPLQLRQRHRPFLRMGSSSSPAPLSLAEY